MVDDCARRLEMNAGPMPRRGARRRATAAVLLLVVMVSTALTAAASPIQPAQPVTTGHVVATVTTLEGTVHMPGVQVELRAEGDGIVLAKTLTDGVGQVTFPDLPPGRYIIKASRPGFVSKDSAVFVVRADGATEVLLDMPLTFVMPTVEVRAENPSPTDSVQPVSMSDMLAGSLLEVAPIEGDDFQSLLPLLPGIVRGPDGRLRIKGGQPTQSALQVSSASLNDPLLRRLRPRAAGAERRVRGGAGQPVRRGVRAVLDEHHPDSHAARHQRLGDQTR